MLVATYPPEPSSDDISYLIVQTDPELSRARLGTLIEEAKLTGNILAVDSQPGFMRHMLEVDGFVERDDPRLETLADDEAILAVKLVGAAARPIGVLDAEGTKT